MVDLVCVVELVELVELVESRQESRRPDDAVSEDSR